MVRLVALAFVVGAAVAASSALTVSNTASPNIIAGFLPEAEPAFYMTPAIQDWPICGVTRSITASTDALDPDFAAGKNALGTGDWNVAIAALKQAELRDPRSADIQNFIGHAYQRLGQLGPAMRHYQQAVTFNRRHRSAHEHLGELYLVLGEPARAEEQLAVLEDICLIPCAELGALKRAIASFKAFAPH